MLKATLVAYQMGLGNKVIENWGKDGYFCKAVGDLAHLCFGILEVLDNDEATWQMVRKGLWLSLLS